MTLRIERFQKIQICVKKFINKNDEKFKKIKKFVMKKNLQKSKAILKMRKKF